MEQSCRDWRYLLSPRFAAAFPISSSDACWMSLSWIILSVPPSVHDLFTHSITLVEVAVEVYEYLDRADHKEENLAHEKRRHWDSREFDEYIILTEGRSCYYQTPEQWVCRKETMLEIKAALALCTEAQRRRFLLYALDGLSYAEIAGLCRCSKAAIQDSIEAVRKKIKKFF